jgi:hypothetical protein
MSNKSKNKRIGIYMMVVTICIANMSIIQAQEQPCDKMDIVLVIDETGGLKHVVREIKNQAADIIAMTTAACTDVRMGLVTFTEGVFVEQDLTSDLALVEVAIGQLHAFGGAAVPENWDGALNLAANRGDGVFYSGGPCFVSGTLNDFRENCRKLVVLLTDAPPSGCNDEYVEGEDNVRAMEIADAAATNGVLVSTILSDNGDDAGEQALLQDCASITGGTFEIVPDSGPDGALAIQSAIAAQACTPASPMFVESISYATAAKGRHLKITVNVQDEFGASISGASVSIDLLRDGGLDVQASGTTGADGTVTFQRNKAPAGTYTTVVTDVTAAGFAWDGATPPNEFLK